MTEISNEKEYRGTTDYPTVGTRLRIARESKNITIDEVAAQLRLTIENVAYLETDQWDKLHGRSYASGYFSNYVNFLGLPHDEMLALFNLEYNSAYVALAVFNNHTNNKGFPIVKILLLIIIGVSSWFIYQYWLQTETLSTENSSMTEQSYLSNVDDVFSGSIAGALPEIESESERYSFEEEMLDNRIIEEMTEENVLLPAETIESQSTLATKQPPEDEVIVESSEQFINDETEEIASASSVFVMRFTEDCWVEVSDSDNNKILNEIVPAGETIEVNGKWPLQIVLGNATAVTATYDNDTFDISEHINGNVARFSVAGPTE